MKIVHLIVITLFILICGGCSVKYVPVKTPCPPDPEMRPVQVINHSLNGKDLDNAIDNHVDLWNHIHKLKKLGCTE